MPGSSGLFQRVRLHVQAHHGKKHQVKVKHFRCLSTASRMSGTVHQCR
jgi:hypothetical protein